MYEWIKGSCFWYDAPIATGGTSGSGLTALQGSEAGKIIALHNMSMAQPTIFIGAVSGETLPLPDGNTLVADLKNDKKYNGEQSEIRKMFTPTLSDVSYDTPFSDFVKDYPEFENAMKQACGGWQEIEGMHGAVPINRVKTFLQERGLDPKHFGWKGLDGRYFEK